MKTGKLRESAASLAWRSAMLSATPCSGWQVVKTLMMAGPGNWLASMTALWKWLGCAQEKDRQASHGGFHELCNTVGRCTVAGVGSRTPARDAAGVEPTTV